jgi:hypothetical protein
MLLCRSDLLEAGVVDFCTLSADTTGGTAGTSASFSVTLLHSKRTLTKLNGPVFVIANYLFDSPPPDVYRVQPVRSGSEYTVNMGMVSSRSSTRCASLTGCGEHAIAPEGQTVSDPTGSDCGRRGVVDVHSLAFSFASNRAACAPTSTTVTVADAVLERDSMALPDFVRNWCRRHVSGHALVPTVGLQLLQSLRQAQCPNEPFALFVADKTFSTADQALFGANDTDCVTVIIRASCQVVVL